MEFQLNFQKQGILSNLQKETNFLPPGPILSVEARQCMPPHRYVPVYASPQKWACVCLSTDIGPAYASPQIWACICLSLIDRYFLFAFSVLVMVSNDSLRFSCFQTTFCACSDFKRFSELVTVSNDFPCFS